MINLKTANFCVWGCKNKYDTFGHVHEAYLRALKFLYPERQVLWLDAGDDISQINFENTLIITADVADLTGLPRRSDCLYAVHNIDAKFKAYLQGLNILNYGVYSTLTDRGSHTENLVPGEEVYYSSQPWEAYASVMFRWGTDLLPHEIEANKPTEVFRKDSKEIVYVGSIGGYYDTGLNPFRRACAESGINFRTIGGFGNSHLPGISMEENIRLIQGSYMAPAICPPIQLEIGYAPCRIFKNISYGQYGVTNSPYVNTLFGGRLIFDPDPYELFYRAKAVLPSVPLVQLHELMDEVARKHTYINKVNALLLASARMLEERHA